MQRTTLRGVRAGLSGGFAVISADLGVMLVPRQHAWWVFGVVAGTMVMVYWWVWAKRLLNLGRNS